MRIILYKNIQTDKYTNENNRSERVFNYLTHIYMINIKEF